MREHGILKRVLLAYDEIIRQIAQIRIFHRRRVSMARTSYESSLRTITRSLKKTICSRDFAKQASWLIWWRRY